MEPMVQEAKDSRACARSCTCLFLGALSESLASWHSSSFGFQVWKAVLCHIDLFEGS